MNIRPVRLMGGPILQDTAMNIPLGIVVLAIAIAAKWYIGRIE